MTPAGRAIVGRAAWLVPLGLAAYLLRFASSWLILKRSGDRRFDPHGFGLLGDGVVLLALAPVVLGLLAWILWRRPWRGILARGITPAGTVVSVVLTILLGAPLPGQVWAWLMLPMAEAWPTLASAGLWLAVVAVGRALAVGAPAPG